MMLKQVSSNKTRNFVRTMSFGLVCALCVVGFYGCSTLTQISNTLTSLKKIQFKLSNITALSLNGVTLSGKSAISDFSITDAAKLLQAYNSKSLPVSFTLNVLAKNPNTGTGGTATALATITGLDWQLYLDDKQTISGDINNAVTVPSSGETTTIPLGMNLDLVQFFADKGYESVVNLALALGGASGSTSRVKLTAQPTIKTPIGNISYPSKITIVNTEFSN